MFTCTYLYKFQNSPTVPAPGCSLYLDARHRAAVTGLALCPVMDQVLQRWAYLAQQVSNKAGKRAQSILEQEQKGPGEPSVLLSVSEDSLLSGHCMKNNICFGVSGSGRWEEAKLVAQAQGCSCTWCLADWARTVTFSAVFLSSVQLHFYLWQSRNVPYSSQESQAQCLKQREGMVYAVGLQQERKGNFPKGFE